MMHLQASSTPSPIPLKSLKRELAKVGTNPRMQTSGKKMQRLLVIRPRRAIITEAAKEAGEVVTEGDAGATREVKSLMVDTQEEVEAATEVLEMDTLEAVDTRTKTKTVDPSKFEAVAA